MPENNFSRGIEMQNLYLRLKNKLEEGGILAASFELRQIIGKFTGDNFYAVRLENEFTNEEIIEIENMVDRRLKGEPLQYILGEWEFMGLNFFVKEGVLIPRPETEQLCAVGFDFLETRPISRRRVLDLCCGSGCVGVSAAKYIAGAEVVSVDKYDIPLEMTAKNAEANGVAIEVRRGDLFEAPPADLGGFDLILCNPPYIKSGDMASLQREVTYEPATALDGGEDGLDFYRAIAEKWLSLLNSDGAIGVEVGIGEAESVASLFEGAGLKDISVTEDYCGIPRIVFAHR